MWRHFAAHADPRPLILTGAGPLEKPAGGFPGRADEAAFLTGRYVLRARLPKAPASADGYRVLPASAAYATIRHRIPGHRARPHGQLVIGAVRLGHAGFGTDRGRRRLPVWRFSFARVHHPADLLAVRPSAVFTAPHPRPLSHNASPYPEDPATSSRDGRTLTISFIGAHAGSKPCDAAYSLIAAGDRNAVAMTIVSHPAPAPTNTTCPAVGYQRGATIHLARPLGPRALVSSNDGAVISVITQNPKRLTVTVAGEHAERAQLGSYCLPTGHGSRVCADAAFDPSPPGRLAVHPRDLVLLNAGAPAKSLSVRLATTNDRGQVSYPNGLLHAYAIGPENRWAVPLPRNLPQARILSVFVRYSFGDASFEAGIHPTQRRRAPSVTSSPRSVAASPRKRRTEDTS